jgi:hypothetical protein
VASSGPQFWRTASVINANNAAPHSYYAVVDDTSAGTHIFLNFDGGTRNSFYYASTTSIQVTDTASNIGGAVTNAWHVAIASVVSGTNNSTVNVDGTTVVTGTLTTNTGVDKPTFGNDAGGFDPFKRQSHGVQKAGVWASSFADATQAYVSQSIRLLGDVDIMLKLLALLIGLAHGQSVSVIRTLTSCFRRSPRRRRAAAAMPQAWLRWQIYHLLVERRAANRRHRSGRDSTFGYVYANDADPGLCGRAAG